MTEAALLTQALNGQIRLLRLRISETQGPLKSTTGALDLRLCRNASHRLS